MNKAGSDALENLFIEMREKSIDISPKELSENSRELSKMYLDEFSTYLLNSEKLKNNYSYEIVYLTTELVKSDFALKIMGDFNAIFKKDTSAWTIDEKVRLIRDTYESIYQNFILITLCMSYSDEYMECLRSDWFKPFEAKDKILKGEDNWMIGEDKVVGKYYLLKTSPMFKFFLDNDKELIKNIRNSDSHYKTMIVGGNVIMLDEANSANITSDVNRIFIQLLDCYRAAYGFYINIFSFKRYWIAPVLGLTFKKELNIKDRAVIYDLISGLINNDKKSIKNMKDSSKVIERTVAFFFVVIYFLNIKLWRILEDEKKFIDKVSSKFSKKFSLEVLDTTRKESVIEIVNFFKIAVAKIDQFATGADKPIYDKIKVEDYSEELILDEFEKFSKKMQEVLQSERKDDGILFGMLSFGMALLTPIGKLKERFETLFTDDSEVIKAKK
ncbi:MAG: hypothetical protein WA004_12260 [Saprospiraceae bacterium]